MKRALALIITVALIMALSAAGAMATELVYEPINPTFGGNPLNGNFLLGKAQSEDDNEDPDIEEAEAASRINEFAESLQSRVLSVLSQRIATGLLGEEGIPTGSFTIGNFDLNVVEDLTEVRVTIVDTSSGQETTVVLPIF